MLPFLKKKQEAAIAIPVGISVEHHEEDYEDIDHEEMLKHCMHEFIEAIHEKNSESALEAFQSIFQLLELEPHEEYGEIENDDEGDEE